MPVYGRRAASEGESQLSLRCRTSIDTASVRQMKARGLGAAEIAKALGISRASVCQALEAGPVAVGSSTPTTTVYPNPLQCWKYLSVEASTKKRPAGLPTSTGSWHRSTTVAAGRPVRGGIQKPPLRRLNRSAVRMVRS